MFTEARVGTAATGAPLPGRGRARTRSASSSAEVVEGVMEALVRASIGPALKASCKAAESKAGQVGGRPAMAMAPMAVKKLPMPPCLG